MQIVTVGPKYQVVIPKEIRKKIKSLKPGKKVGVYAVDEKSIAIDPDPQSWVDRTYGMMKDAWKDIDPVAEVEKMKDEWEERLTELDQIRQGKNPYAKGKQV